MDMKPLISLSIPSCFLIFVISTTIGFKWKPSSMKTKFEFYKEKYNKKYKNPDDEAFAYNNFVNNWKNLEDLNKKTLDPNTVYMVNSFADRNPAAVEEHFGITISPFVNELNETLNEKALRVRQQRNQGRSLVMYDLDKAEELYEAFLKKYRKVRPKGSYLNQVHYLKFVKTLSDINKHNFMENDNKTYDENADRIEHPKKYFF